MDEKACRELIEASRKLHLELGGTKGPAKEEQVTMDFAFATVVTIAPIKAGEALTKRTLGEAPRHRLDSRRAIRRAARQDRPPRPARRHTPAHRRLQLIPAAGRVDASRLAL